MASRWGGLFTCMPQEIDANNAVPFARAQVDKPGVRRCPKLLNVAAEYEAWKAAYLQWGEEAAHLVIVGISHNDAAFTQDQFSAYTFPSELIINWQATRSEVMHKSRKVQVPGGEYAYFQNA